jgi:hypothetical protein
MGGSPRVGSWGLVRKGHNVNKTALEATAEVTVRRGLMISAQGPGCAATTG